MDKSKSITILDVNVNVCSMAEVINYVEEYLQTGKQHKIFIVNAHTLNLAWSNPEYRRILNSADLVLNDGSGVSWAAGLQKKSFVQNLVGTDLMPEIFSLSQRQGYSLYLLGGKTGVAEASAKHLLKQFPDLKIAGFHHGYNDGNEEAVVREICQCQPDILVVGMGNPLQEQWIYRYGDQMGVPVSIGIGGLLGYYSGDLTRAPKWMRNHGLEWLFLLIRVPRRSWRRYILGNPLFIARALRAKSKSK